MGFFRGGMGEWPHQPLPHLQHGGALSALAHGGHEDSQHCLSKNENIMLWPHPRCNKQISVSFFLDFFLIRTPFPPPLFKVQHHSSVLQHFWNVELSYHPPHSKPNQNPIFFLIISSTSLFLLNLFFAITKRTKCSLRSSDVARVIVFPLSHKMHSFSWLSTLTTS